MMKYLLCLIFFWTLLPSKVEAKRLSPKDAFADSVVQMIFQYAQTVDTTGRGAETAYAYTKFQIRTNKRNASLMLVPTMYAVAHGGGRKFLCEFYNRIKIDDKGKPMSKRLLNISTIPHRRSTMDQALRYMTPDVYGETLFQENILSPFHRTNRRYYRYTVTALPFGMAQVYAYPRIKNTQTVETRAIVNAKTGQISLVDFEGEYDMTHFYITIRMGRNGFHTLGPAKCDMRANFKFMGNKISGLYTTVYGLQNPLSDSLDNVNDTALMNKVRPIKLNTEEESIYVNYFNLQKQNQAKREAQSKSNKMAKEILWDVVGDNMLNRISTGFGKSNQGYFRLSPIFNPLYMGYSPRKGLVYKFDVKSNYAFDHNFQLSLQFRGGYSTKQHRLYYHVPFVFNYNEKHEGYVTVEFGNGNRIATNSVAKDLLKEPEQNQMHIDSIYTFKDAYLRITNYWRFSPKISIEAGFMSHKRDAVSPAFYESFGYPTKYISIAPTIGVHWSPKGASGPVFTIDYERGLKGVLGSNIDYERIEMDAQTILNSSRRRSYSLRVGTGFYTKKGDHWDFVDYSNFHDDNIPGGWNDSWSGEFELLNSQWYNSSEYYLRGNFTYESPMMIAAWLPLVGRYIEKERLYGSALVVRHLCPYTEWGYGVTTRLITLGAFAAFHEAKFDGFGFKFGFELFRNW